MLKVMVSELRRLIARSGIMMATGQASNPKKETGSNKRKRYLIFSYKRIFLMTKNGWSKLLPIIAPTLLPNQAYREGYSELPSRIGWLPLDEKKGIKAAMTRKKYKIDAALTYGPNFFLFWMKIA